MKSIPLFLWILGSYYQLMDFHIPTIYMIMEEFKAVHQYCKIVVKGFNTII